MKKFLRNKIDLIKTKKDEYAIWANMPKDPSLN